jgi:cytochrome c peroxidase
VLADKKRFFRIPLGGRPLGVRISGDDRLAFVANYLENGVQVVDLQLRRVVRILTLGGTAEPSLARQGERIFFDGRRSLDQWYSCHTCHYEGGTNAVTMDTLNDGSSFSFKTVLPLYRLRDTAPWTWHGWQRDLDEAMHKSLTSTLLGAEPTAEAVAALSAYVDTLQSPLNPWRRPDGSLTEAAQRGKLVFDGQQAACATCHTGSTFTDGEIHDVGTGKSSDRYQGFNTPSLLGVHRKTHLLHDGRCTSMEQLLRGPHNPAAVSGTHALNDRQLRDLVAYLRSL